MALQIEYSDIFGNFYSTAYCRIGKVIIDNPTGLPKTVTVVVSIFSSKISREKCMASVGVQSYDVDIYIPSPPITPDPVPVPEDTTSSTIIYFELQQPIKIKNISFENFKSLAYSPAIDPDNFIMSDIYEWLKLRDLFKNAVDV